MGWRPGGSLLMRCVWACRCAHHRAPGAELIEPAHFGTPEIGAILEQPTAHQWQESWGSTARASAAARAVNDVSGVVSLDGLAARIETVLGEVGSLN